MTTPATGTGRVGRTGPAGRTAEADVRRRYLVLTASRWLPTGLLIPLLVIAAQQRGLDLVQIGLLTAVSGAVVLALEVPTGGLSDAIGRRPVLLAACAASLVSTGLQVFATTVTVYLVAFAVEGVYRALDSGPLDAWYVDRAQAADPDADIERGLAQRGVVLSAAVAVGALACGALALLPDVPGLPVLALPLLVSLVLRALDGALIAALLREDGTRPPAGTTRRRRVAAAVRDTAGTVREALALVRVRTALLALVGAEALWGAGMVGVEVFAAPRLVDLLDDARQGVLVFALASAVGWAASALGSSATPWLAGRLGWVGAAVTTRAVQGAAVLAAGAVAGPVGLLTGYLGFYLVHGAANVAHYGLVNRHVGAEHRATVLSVNSLAARLGGVVAAPVLGLVATGAGLPAVFVVAAVLLAAGAPLYLLARPTAGPSALSAGRTRRR